MIATARWSQLAQRAADSVDLSGLMIACSGAQVRVLSDRTDVFDVRLPLEFALQLAKICDANRCIAWVALDEIVLMKAEGQMVLEDMPEVQGAESLESRIEVAPRIAMIQGTRIQGLIREMLEPVWGDRVRFVTSINTQGKELLTLTATGGDKGAALRAACEYLRISPSDVVAFGDAENDLELFQAAGASFAMGQASEAVKAAATAVTASNLDDGVGRAVEDLLKRGAGAFD